MSYFKFFTTVFAIFIVATVAMLSRQANAATLVTNGDFQTGELTGWTTFITGVGVIGTPSVVEFDTVIGEDSLAARLNVGNQIVTNTLQGGGIFQEFTTITSGLLDLSLDIASRNPSEFGSNLSGGHFSLLFDGVLVNVFDFGSIVAGETLRSSLTGLVFADAGLHELRILVARTGTQSIGTPFQYIDNVIATQVVPIPAALPLFGTGLVAMGLIGWRRKRKGTSTQSPINI